MDTMRYHRRYCRLYLKVISTTIISTTMMIIVAIVVITSAIIIFTVRLYYCCYNCRRRCCYLLVSYEECPDVSHSLDGWPHRRLKAREKLRRGSMFSMYYMN